MFDLIIIGGGAAGFTSAIYAARKKLNTLLIYKKLGGQTAQTGQIQNWPGNNNVLGPQLSQDILDHAKSFPIEIKDDLEIISIEKIDKNFKITDSSNNKYDARAIIIATGKNPRRLNIPGENEFEGKGVAYCSICDAPLFTGKDVAVMGSGNAGLDAAWDLTKYANKIYILESNGKINGDITTKEKLEQSGKVTFLFHCQAKSIIGKNSVETLTYFDTKKQNDVLLNVQGIFVEIGSVPATDFIKNLVSLNDRGEIIIDQKTNATSIPGIFAAGDATDIPFKQIIIASGEGAKAALNAEKYLISNN